MTAARPVPPNTARSTLITSRCSPRMSAAGVVVLSLGATLATPLPSAAAPAPCEQAESYAAESGSQLFRLNKLDLRPTGIDSEPTNDVGLAEAKSALIAAGTVNAAAVTRLLDAETLDDPLIQSAPPTSSHPVRRKTAGRAVGPFALGDGTLSSRARWDPGMACGAKTGDVTRAEATLATVGIGGDLVRVPGKAGTLSTTALHAGARTVTTAAVQMRGLDLLCGAVHVRIIRPPALLASMSTKGGGEIRYRPTALEVSGEGIKTTRLDTAGDDIEIAVGDDATEPGTGRSAESSTLGNLLSGLPKLSGLTKGSPLPLPAVPGVPPVDGPDSESVQVTGPGTRLRIALGDVRQAESGHSIAARATAIKIAITQGKDHPGYGHDRPNRSGVVLDLDVGILAAAAAAPEPRAGGVRPATAGSGAGLPITGPRVDVLGMAGGALLIAGAVALTFGLRRRRFHP